LKQVLGRICGEDGEFRFGKAVQMVANRFRRLGDENLSNHDISISQLRILGYLARFGEERDVYQKDLEEEFGVRRSSVTGILQNMEKRGLLARTASDHDARVKKVLLTEKGKALDAELRSYIRSLEDALMDGVSREEREVLQRALVKMLYNLEETERKRV